MSWQGWVGIGLLVFAVSMVAYLFYYGVYAMIHPQELKKITSPNPRQDVLLETVGRRINKPLTIMAVIVVAVAILSAGAYLVYALFRILVY